MTRLSEEFQWRPLALPFACFENLPKQGDTKGQLRSGKKNAFEWHSVYCVSVSIRYSMSFHVNVFFLWGSYTNTG